MTGRLIQYDQAQTVRLPVRTRDFNEGVNIANRRHVVGDEWVQNCVQVDLVGNISPDVVEQVVDLGGYVGDNIRLVRYRIGTGRRMGIKLVVFFSIGFSMSINVFE